jgi:hypothetical protein
LSRNWSVPVLEHLHRGALGTRPHTVYKAARISAPTKRRLESISASSDKMLLSRPAARLAASRARIAQSAARVRTAQEAAHPASRPGLLTGSRLSSSVARLTASTSSPSSHPASGPASPASNTELVLTPPTTALAVAPEDGGLHHKRGLSRCIDGERLRAQRIQQKVVAHIALIITYGDCPPAARQLQSQLDIHTCLLGGAGPDMGGESSRIRTEARSAPAHPTRHSPPNKAQFLYHRSDPPLPQMSS